jgi:hypothetical protein
MNKNNVKILHQISIIINEQKQHQLPNFLLNFLLHRLLYSPPYCNMGLGF